MSQRIQGGHRSRIIDNGLPAAIPRADAPTRRLGAPVRWDVPVQLSQDGAVFLCCPDAGPFTVQDVRTRSVRCVLEGAGPSWRWEAAALAPDGKRVAVFDRIEALRIYDAVTGAVEREMTLASRAISASFAPDGARLAILEADSGEGQTVRVLDLESGALADYGLTGPDACRILLGAGTLAVVSSEGHIALVELRDAPAGMAAPLWHVRGYSALDGGWSRDGRFLAADQQDLLGFDLSVGGAPGDLHVTVTELPYEKLGRVLGFDGERVFLAAWRGLLAVDRSGTTLAAYVGHGSARALGLSPGGEVVALITADETEHWDIQSAEPLVYAASRSVHAELGLYFSRDANSLVCASGRDPFTVERWDIETGMPLSVVMGTPEAEMDLLEARSADPHDWRGLVAALAARRYTVRDVGARWVLAMGPRGYAVFDARSFDLVLELEPYNLVAALLPDGSGVVLGHHGHPFSIVDVPSGTVRSPVDGGRALELDVVAPLGSKGAFAGVSSGTSTAITLFDADGAPDGELARVPGARLHVLCASPDGTLLLAGGRGCAWLWSVERRRVVPLIESDGRTTCAVAFSPDGARCAAASTDGDACVWDVRAILAAHDAE